ncbi:DUF211 domain-containing protein [Halorussus halophilus]|uniref:DUF211 domain-containing protein n=1 Tax=Halorussus halophilus TaxID=2650975 RepID=UPI0013019992|nr:DUF211 domain-containing protein [Halorussus halophilus]
MAPLRRIVVDVLKPYEPPLPEFARQVTDLTGVSGVNVTVIELDEEVQNVKLTVEGEDVDFGRIEDAIDQLGASLHSIDQVACGEYVVEERATPQD